MARIAGPHHSMTVGSGAPSENATRVSGSNQPSTVRAPMSSSTVSGGRGPAGLDAASRAWRSSSPSGKVLPYWQLVVHCGSPFAGPSKIAAEEARHAAAASLRSRSRAASTRARPNIPCKARVTYAWSRSPRSIITRARRTIRGRGSPAQKKKRAVQAARPHRRGLPVRFLRPIARQQ